MEGNLLAFCGVIMGLLFSCAEPEDRNGLRPPNADDAGAVTTDGSVDLAAAPPFGSISQDFATTVIKHNGGDGILRQRTSWIASDDHNILLNHSYMYVVILEGLNDSLGDIDASVRLSLYNSSSAAYLGWPKDPNLHGWVVNFTPGTETATAVFEGTVSNRTIDVSLVSGSFSAASSSTEGGYTGIKKNLRLQAPLVPNDAGTAIRSIGGVNDVGELVGIWPARDADAELDPDFHELCGGWGSALDLLALDTKCGSTIDLGVPARDVDGDGIEQFLSSCPELIGVEKNNTWQVQCCIDGDGTVEVGSFCANKPGFADGWEFRLDFMARPVVFSYPSS